MDLLSKALADPPVEISWTKLFKQDGQTLSQLEQRPAMTRFA